MQIPNSIIHIRCSDGRGYGPLIVPAYHAKVMRYVHRGRLDDSEGKGIVVSDYPDDGDDSARYTFADSVNDELSHMRKLYKGDTRGYYADLAFSEDELEAEILKMLELEAIRISRVNSKMKDIVAHKSFIDFGLNADQAVALQQAGYMTRAECVGKSLISLNNVPGIDIVVAKKLTTADVEPTKK